MKATIWHNPRCSKSREALALLERAHADVTVVEYLKTPPARADIAAMLERAGLSARDGLRLAEESAKPLRQAGDVAILDAMAANPILIERPFVVTDKGARLARPPERVREIL